MFSIGKRTPVHVTDLLSAYLDNQLHEQSRAQVEAHLRDCAACADDLRSLRATVQALRLLPAVAVPRSFILQPQYQPRRLSPLLPVLRLATSAVAIALVAVMAGSMLSRGYQPAMAPAPLAVATQAAAAPNALDAPAMQKTQGSSESAPAVAAAAPLATQPALAGEAAPTKDAEAATLAAPKGMATPAARSALPPAAPAPSAPSVADAQATVTPTLTPPPTLLPTMTPLPAPSPSPSPVPSVAPSPTLPPEAPASAPDRHVAGAPLRSLQIGLAALLAVLVVATVAASRRQR